MSLPYSFPVSESPYHFLCIQVPPHPTSRLQEGPPALPQHLEPDHHTLSFIFQVLSYQPILEPWFMHLRQRKCNPETTQDWQESGKEDRCDWSFLKEKYTQRCPFLYVWRWRPDEWYEIEQVVGLLTSAVEMLLPYVQPRQKTRWRNDTLSCLCAQTSAAPEGLERGWQ